MGTSDSLTGIVKHVTLILGCEGQPTLTKLQIFIVEINTQSLRKQLAISMAGYVAESERLWLQPLNVEEHLQDYFEISSSHGGMLWS